MKKNAKIYIAGHAGMVGSAIVRCLKKNGYDNLVFRTHSQLDLTRQEDVELFFKLECPEYVIIAAARVGGIADTLAHPSDFLLRNLQIEGNIISAAHCYGVKKLIFISSAVIYPVGIEDKIAEDRFLSAGLLDEANESYALAKICGSKLCSYYHKQYGDNFISVVPSNLYGICDNFDPAKSHLVPAMIQRFHQAKVNGLESVEIWGTGNARREILNADDLAAAIFLLMITPVDDDIFNVGAGSDISIKDIAFTIAKIVEYTGNIAFDPTKPEGAKRRLLDSHRLNLLGWNPKISFEDGLKTTYEWYLKNIWEG